MKTKMICIAAVLAAAIGSEASAGSLISHGGNGSRSLINIAPNVGVLNGSNTNILSGLLSGNSILNGNSILTGNNGNGLLGLGILSGNNSGNVTKHRRRCGCR